MQVSFFIVLIDIMKKMSIKLVLLIDQTQFHFLRRNLLKQVQVSADSQFTLKQMKCEFLVLLSCLQILVHLPTEKLLICVDGNHRKLLHLPGALNSLTIIRGTTGGQELQFRTVQYIKN